jgi:spore germination protein
MLGEVGNFIRGHQREIALTAALALGAGGAGGAIAQDKDGLGESPRPEASLTQSSPDALTDRIPALRVSIPYWVQHTAFESIQAHVASFGVEGSHIALMSYKLGEDGELKHYDPADEDAEIIQFAHDASLPVLATVTNEEDGWDTERVERIINKPKRRDAHIEDLVALTHEIGVDGISIDYESLPPEERDNFTDFIAHLADRLHADGKKLGISLHIKYGDDHDWNSEGAGAQDFAALGQYADYLSPMTFDETGDGGDPGPSRSCERYELLVDYATANIPPEKVFMGNPINADVWEQGTTDAEEIDWGQMQEIIEEKDLTPEFIPNQCGSVVEFEDDGTEYVAWFDDVNSVKARMEISNEDGANIALWSVGNEPKEDDLPGRNGVIPGPGGEDPRIWDLFVSSNS